MLILLHIEATVRLVMLLGVTSEFRRTKLSQLNMYSNCVPYIAPRSGTWTFEKIKDGDFCTPTSSTECPELDKK